jgi:hypothetical protein
LQPAIDALARQANELELSPEAVADRVRQRMGKEP